MQSTSLAYLKKEIQAMPKAELIEVCNKLIKYKKENKELLHYVLFESTNEANYVEQLKNEVSKMFQDVNTQTVYFAKKTIRKILRFIAKYCKFSEIPTTHIDVLIHFCKEMNQLSLHWKEHKVMVNLYQSQLKKIEKLIATLHEDLQYDYRQKLILDQ
jgi:hypothetical protein